MRQNPSPSPTDCPGDGNVTPLMPNERSTTVLEHVDEQGRHFGFAPVDNDDADSVGIHFNDFSDGSFQRQEMLGSDPSRDWLFLSDTYGEHDNGCFYLGEQGDLYVQQATRAVITSELARRGHGADRAVMIGSSMGATGALTFGLELGAAGIVAICPYIDLDTSARNQDLFEEVAWICPEGATMARDNQHLTRAIHRQLDEWLPESPLPRLFLQSCQDDAGVHDQQVLPLVERWLDLGGTVDLDVRPVGGHTSDHASRNLLLDVTRCYLDGDTPDLERYRTDPEFASTITQPRSGRGLRSRVSLAGKRLLGR